MDNVKLNIEDSIVLLELIGLEVVKFWEYAVETGDSVIVAKKS
jgi:hypothetical protein